MPAVLWQAPDTTLGPSSATAEDGRALEPRIGELCGQLNAVHAELVDVIADAARTGAWQGAGIRSLSHWVSWKCGMSNAHARQLVDIAERRESHPELSARFDDGLVSVDQAAIAVQCHPVDDADFAHAATVMTIAQLRLLLRASQPAPDAPAPDAAKPESVAMFHSRNGDWRCDIRLDADRGELVRAALHEARDRLFHDGVVDVSWADALVDMAKRSLDSVAVSRRERFRINLFLNPAEDARATWVNGIAIPDAIRDLLLCDGTINPTFTEAGYPVNVGRSLRVVPDRLRRLIERRDQKCRVPWCQRERGLQIHHLVEWKDGGRTDTANLIALCEHCHRQHHKGQLGITGNADRPDGLTFTGHNGHLIDFAAHPQRPSRPAPAPKRPYRHPDGGRMQKSAILFNTRRRQLAPDHHRRFMPGHQHQSISDDEPSAN